MVPGQTAESFPDGASVFTVSYSNSSSSSVFWFFFFRFNSIQALSETSFAGLSKLELLMIHGNDIPSIPDGALRDLSSLQVNPGFYEHQELQLLRPLMSKGKRHTAPQR